MAEDTALVELHFVEESGKDPAMEALGIFDAKNVRAYEGFVEGVVNRMDVDSLKKEVAARGLIINIALPPSPNVELASTGDQLEKWFPGSVIRNEQVRQSVAKFQNLAKWIDYASTPDDPVSQTGTNTAYRLLDSMRTVAIATLDGIDIEGLTGDKFQNTPDPAVMLARDTYLVRMRAGLRPEWVREIRDVGVECQTQHGPFTYVMQLAPHQLKAIESMPFVFSTKRYGLMDTLSKDFQKALVDLANQKESLTPASIDAYPVPDTFDVALHSEGELDDIVATLTASPNIQVVEQARNQVRVKSLIDNPVLAALANDPRVRNITPYAAPTLLCDELRARIGCKPVNAADDFKWDGTGQIVAIIDSGIDGTHEDLSTQLVHPPLRFRSGLAEDMEGHGTHVAGIVAGTGSASGGKFAGVAPGAKLITIGVRNSDKRLDLPLDMGELLRIGYENGARIFNLSFKYNAASGAYESGASSLDHFVWEHPDALVVVAAGNSGTAKGNAGKHRLQSIGSPGSAKNALTVGSASSARAADPPNTWGQLMAEDFPDSPAADEPVSGDISLPAGNSSRGPTEYMSIKPDVLAPGTMIVSTRSSLCDKPFFMGSGSYTALSGTSMAAPAAAGAAAILRQFLQSQLGCRNPSAALLKALLIASAQPLGYSSPLQRAFEPDVGFPDFHQGFGCIDLRRILPNLERPAGCQVTFVDVPAASPQALHGEDHDTGSSSHLVQRFRIASSADSGPMRVVLTWTDPSGMGPQHNLNLALQSGTLTRCGNDAHKLNNKFTEIASLLEGMSFDLHNSVEMIQLREPPAEANCTMKVEARSIFKGRQGYALVVVGPIEKGFKEAWVSALPLKAEAFTF